MTVYDSLGASHNITFNFTNQGDNTWSYQATIPEADITAGNGVTLTNPVVLASGTMTFNGDGTLATPTTANGTISLSTTAFGTLTDGANSLSMKWDMYGKNSNGLITQTAGADSTPSTEQNRTAAARW